ncbi:uncharacterized protein G2W53_036743 [Senna tora]|uniref:Uncharacterized protein n=1 Tax=Senna tora TaxID=362788 RepID=A0A834SWF5_9FABA|nr:uncharacterized protein G2W53_036743 [Senna tora]
MDPIQYLMVLYRIHRTDPTPSQLVLPLRVVHEPEICSLARQKKEQPNRNPELKKSK